MKVSGTKVDFHNPVSRSSLEASDKCHSSGNEKSEYRCLWHQSALIWSLRIIIMRIVLTFCYKISRISGERELDEARNICWNSCISQYLGTSISEREIVSQKRQRGPMLLWTHTPVHAKTAGYNIFAVDLPADILQLNNQSPWHQNTLTKVEPWYSPGRFGSRSSIDEIFEQSMLHPVLWLPCTMQDHGAGSNICIFLKE